MAPASSNNFLYSSDFSFETAWNIGLGRFSIKSLASFKPKDVKLRTIFITFILLEVGTSFNITLNSVFSSTKFGSIFETKGEEEEKETAELASIPNVSSKKYKK